MKCFWFVLFFSFVSFAYVPPTRMILERTVENSGSGGYQIEKEIRFSNPEIPLLKEVWSVESERTLKLVVFAKQNPQEKLTIYYVQGQKILQKGSQKDITKLPTEHAERIFHFRSPENMAAYLNHQKILNTAVGNLDLARLNRAQGVVNYGVGKVSDGGSSSLFPYLWIEQDRFLIRKIRFESGAEITADQFQNYPKGLLHPLRVSVGWSDQKVKLSTTSVELKKFPPQTFQNSAAEDSLKFWSAMSKYSSVLEFYTRFR